MIKTVKDLFDSFFFRSVVIFAVLIFLSTAVIVGLSVYQNGFMQRGVAESSNAVGTKVCCLAPDHRSN